MKDLNEQKMIQELTKEESTKIFGGSEKKKVYIKYVYKGNGKIAIVKA